MCDFRNIKKIQLIESGKELSIDETKIISMSDWERSYYNMDHGSTIEKGFYLIAFTGSFHKYYDGETWLGEGNNGFKVLEYEHVDCGWSK